ncbi:sensor histidine kinase [Streptomyces sp. 4.24]|uniref:sensor histidine kinase n=1 Tax=Streptomyces tritrimontium TaxID=3406573 RepID=UPI003BB546E8
MGSVCGETAVDLLRPGSRARVEGPGEVAELTTSFNAMLGRLEAERTTSSALALSAQEAERRRIARRLRPGVLEDLGLHSALRALTTEFTTGSLTVRHFIGSGLPALDEAAELVVYRVAQEALTNAARHAGATDVEVRLSGRPAGTVRLLVRDNGRGIRLAGEGAGIQGMRERALLIGADLSVGDGPHGGTDVRLDVSARGTEESRPVAGRASEEAGAPVPREVLEDLAQPRAAGGR